MGAHGRMTFGGAHPLDGFVGKGQVDLSRGGAGVVGRKSESAEQVLGDAVMPSVFHQGVSAPGSQAALSPIPDDEADCLQRRDVTQGGWGANFQGRGDGIEGHPAFGGLSRPDGLERFDLTAR